MVCACSKMLCKEAMLTPEIRAVIRKEYGDDFTLFLGLRGLESCVVCACSKMPCKEAMLTPEIRAVIRKEYGNDFTLF